MRAPLLGIYALLAEWNTLMNPQIERSVAHLKLGWWQEELHRLLRGTAVHPITVYLLGLPGANRVDFAPLVAAVEATAVAAGGSPVEHGADLKPHATALWGGPLDVAAHYLDGPSITASASAYAVGLYLSRAIEDYGLEHRFGRVPFAVDELLAAGIEDADLASLEPSTRLAAYLERLRIRGQESFDAAAAELPDAARSSQRHLLVLAALGSRRLRQRGSPRQSRRWQDMLLAWSTARRSDARAVAR